MVGGILLAGGAFWIYKATRGNLLDEVDRQIFLPQQEEVQVRTLKQELLFSGSLNAQEEAFLFPRAEGKLLRNLLREGDPVQKGQTVSLIERDEVGAVYEPLRVPSTLTGVVGRIYLDPGENVTRNTPVALVVNQQKIRLAVDVPERYTEFLHKGQQAFLWVDSFPEETFVASLSLISPVVDKASRSLAVEFQTDNSQGLLKAGMFARVNLILARKEGVVSIPKQHLYEQPETGKKYVLVASPDGAKALQKEIKTGFEDSQYVEITEGLNPGDVILQFMYGLKDGSHIDLGDSHEK